MSAADGRMTVDLHAYCARIGLTGPLRPDHATLAALLDAHTAAIPFENFDCLLGRPIRLDLGALQQKLVTGRRGGYCFEHATLVAAVLRAIGYAPAAHTARVIAFGPRAEAPRTHMFLTVPLDGVRFVVDPGFGFYRSTVPLLLGGDGTATHRMVQEDGTWVHYANRDGASFPAWISTLEPENDIDFEMGSYFTATHPRSPFTQTILASARRGGGGVNLLGDRLTVIEDGTATPSLLPDRAALRETVRIHWGFDLPDLEWMPVPAVPGWT